MEGFIISKVLEFQYLLTRGCLKKKWTDILISTAKTTIPRAKVQENGQNYASRGLI